LPPARRTCLVPSPSWPSTWSATGSAPSTPGSRPEPKTSGRRVAAAGETRSRRDWRVVVAEHGEDERMHAERRSAEHYTHGSLEQVILDALRAAGKDPDHLTPADLAPVDEFHIGGRQATIDFAAELGVPRSAALLDIGSGLGGASRYFAHVLGCRVTGLDLT